MKTIIAYTDGSAVVRGKDKGKGGFGVYFPNFYGRPKGIHTGFLNTKTGRTEMHALLSAIEAFHYNRKEDITLRVYSDSQYVTKAFTDGRLDKWRKNGWQNSSGNVKNKGLWVKILKELESRPFLTLEMVWVKGHQLDREKDPIKKEELKKDPHVIGNAMADALADRWRLGINLKHDL
tara:strand:- start:165 stop:698 length:534 start_codon:yes stop_codon:yes gene_type:complete